MIELFLSTIAGIALLAVVVVLLRRPAALRPSEAPPAEINLEDLSARHCRYFPQVRQAFSEADEVYLRDRASAAVLHDWREARQRVMREFLNGLYDDFTRLNRLSRTVSRMAPQLDNLHEADLFWLGVRFRLVYQVALAELSVGRRPVNDFRRLAEMVGELGSALERTASVLAEGSAIGRPSTFTT